jgi:hypothetical protein
MNQTKTEKPVPAEAAPAEPEQKTGEEAKKDRKKKAVKAGVAVVTSASVLVGGLFSSPEALLADEQNLNPAAISQNDSDDDQDGDEEDSREEEKEQEAVRLGLKAALRQRILALPLSVRVFVMIPLWAFGWAIWNVATGLWTMLLGPIAGKAVSWIFLLAVLLGAFVLGAKALFPDVPLKKIVNKKSILGLVIGGLALGVADLTVPLFWDGYEGVAKIVRAVGMALILGITLFALCVRVVRKHRAAQAAAAEAAGKNKEPEEPKPWTDAEILALADSVSRKR